MDHTIKEISTEELIRSFENNNIHIIDIRSADAYNGWKLKDEKRGGHIPGSRSLPFKWTKYIDWIEIVRSKDILLEHKVIIYGYNDEEILHTANLFVKAGYTDVKVYNKFIEDWASNPDLPMQYLERYEQLVYPEFVNSIITGEEPMKYKGRNVVICHAHYQNRNAYITGHIPKAVDIDTNSLESEKTWNRRSSEELKQTLKNHGITSDTMVILYGKFLAPDNNDQFPGSAAGHIGAIRSAFIMMYAGVKDVRVLNGGFQSWIDAGLEINTDDIEKIPVPKFGSNIPVNPKLAVDIEKAKLMLKSDDAELISVRSWNEFIGEVSGYNYIEKKGRIPGAIFGNCGTDAYHMENYRNPDHTIREYHETEEIWKEAGITPDKHLAFYCGTGWRGSEAFYNAWLMGWPRVSVFDGGWFEWSKDPENPIETGVPNITESN